MAYWLCYNIQQLETWSKPTIFILDSAISSELFLFFPDVEEESYLIDPDLILKYEEI